MSLLALPVPARASDDSAGVKSRLAATADAMNRTEMEIRRLQDAVAARQPRVERERTQVRQLARALYQQPDSAVVLVAQSSSLAEAVSRATEVLAAADRARVAQAALQRDVDLLTADRERLEGDRARLADQKRALEAEYADLVARELAAREAAARAEAARAAAPKPLPPVAAPAGAPPGGSIQQLILTTWGPLGPGVAQWALRIAQCESGLNPMAVNRWSGASGLFQFMPATWAGTPYRAQSPFDPVANTQAAAWLYQRYGAGQWDCSRRV